MRPGEIRALTWEDFDRETWTIRLHARDAKSGYGRALALDGEVRVVIENRLRNRRLHTFRTPLASGNALPPGGDFCTREDEAEVCFRLS
jgi:integrase